MQLKRLTFVKSILVYIFICSVVASCASNPDSSSRGGMALLEGVVTPADESVIVGRIQRNTAISHFKNIYLVFNHFDENLQQKYAINEDDNGWFFMHLPPGEYFIQRIIGHHVGFADGFLRGRQSSGYRVGAILTVPKKPSALYVGTLSHDIKSGWSILDESGLVDDVVKKNQLIIKRPIEKLHMKMEEIR